MSVIDLLPTSWLLPAAGIALAVTGATAGVQTWRLHTAQADLARESSVWAKQLASLEKSAREASEAYREQEAQAQADVNAKDAAYVETLTLLKRSAAARDASVVGMRSDLAAIAAAASAAASSPGNACRSQDERIARGASLLSEGLGLVAECQGLAQRLDAKVTTLQQIH